LYTWNIKAYKFDVYLWNGEYSILTDMSERRYVHLEVLAREPINWGAAANLVRSFAEKDDNALGTNETHTLAVIVEALEEEEKRRVCNTLQKE
jgi:hypothetical protein